MTYFLVNFMMFLLGMCIYLALPATSSHGSRSLTTMLIVFIVVLLKVLHDVHQA